NICRDYAKEISDFIKKLQNENYKVLSIFGIENSPTCAVEYLFERGRKIKGRGIFIEEIKKELDNAGINIPLIGINIYGMKKTIKKLSDLLEKTRNLDNYFSNSFSV
ncbi:MAG: hypothetical protein J7J93_01450, partial [Candidatus Aenigmarchaeota archaeon]|nr:hypothetical protein [Candidatus Aenigmarchaeota archaeon]